MNTNPQTDALRSRWTLEGRVPLSGVADGAEWHRARSIATGEDVVLFVVRGEAALEAADAVRRAYLVEDPHLLTVKDIVVLDDPRETSSTPLAPAEGPTTVVEYALPPAPPLAALLAKGPLHPETARAIIGEAATGLEVARRRGVRHQLLDSNRVFVDTRSGDVVLLGIGVEAASHPGLDRSREVASFQDTAALVALLYRALTGRSPRPDATGTVPRPSTLTDTDIPADLDLLCDLVLNESADDIPETTRELIEELQPWQSIPVTLEAYAREEAEPAEAESADAAPADSEPGPAQPGAAGPASAEPEPADVPEDELESTALMGAVPDDDDLPEEDTIARPGLAAAATAGAAGAAGIAGAAALASADERTEDGTSTRDRSAATDESPTGTGTPAEETPADDSASAGEESGADDAASRRTATEARALVDDLHLDQKRDTSAFPGHLDITRPAAPEEPPAAETASSEQPTGTGAAALAAGGATAAGSAVAGGAAAAAASQDETGPDAGIPSRTSGTHWPLAGAGSESGEAPLAPSTDEATRQMPAAASSAAAATPDQSAPTPSHPVVHGAEAADGPVPVAGRTTPVSRTPEGGPIVVQGRGRSMLDEPEESTVPFQRGSLFRDVVGVAVDNDAPETYTLGPRDREKRSLQSQWIIIGGAIAVMIALVIALTTITSDIRDILEDPLATSAPPATTAPPTEEETGEAPVEPTAEETEEELPPPEIESVGLIALPDGEEPDHTDQEDRLHDGDTSDYWSTQHYASPDFGGLKEGVGIRLQFAEPSSFSAMTVTTALNNGGVIELRTVNEDGSPGEVLATGEFVADGEVRLEAPEKLETDKVMLWIPELPPDSAQDGRFRARIAEIQAE